MMTPLPATLLTKLNELGGANGIGGSSVENDLSAEVRGVYETPGGTILLTARRAMDQSLDGGAAHQKDELMPRYAELVYNGFWFSPEREMLQAAIDGCRGAVRGVVRVKLYKGNVIVTGRKYQIRSITLTWSPSKKGLWIMITPTHMALSASMRCGCA